MVLKIDYIILFSHFYHAYAAHGIADVPQTVTVSGGKNMTVIKKQILKEKPFYTVNFYASFKNMASRFII